MLEPYASKDARTVLIEASRSLRNACRPRLASLRTVRASFDAYGSSIGQRTYGSTRLPALALKTTCTLRSGSQQRNRRKPHQQERCAPPTFLHCFFKSVCSRFTYRQHQREVCRLSPRSDVATPIRPITDRPSLAPSSFTRRPKDASCESRFPNQSWLARRKGMGRRRAYHVPPLSQCGLGRASPPVAQRLRRRSSEPPDLTTYLLVQAYQHLAAWPL